MKTFIKIAPVAAIAALLVACGGPTTNGDKLNSLIAERDSLKVEHKEIGKRLKDLDYQISELDTAKKITLVTTLTVEPKSFKHYFDVRGNVEAEKNSAIYPETMGNVVKINVKEGSVVSKGQVLIELDASVVENQIKQTESSLELATSMYNKQKSLYDQEIGSEVQYLQAKTNKETLESALKTLKAQEAMASITAPFNGIVDEVFPKIGSMANPQFPVVRMVSLDKIYIDSDISEAYIGKIKKGTPVVVSFPAIDKEIDTKINYVGNFINPNNRTFKIRLDIPNTPDKLYKPNMISVLKILDYSNPNAIVLPASIVQQDASGNDYVYVAEKNGNGSYITKHQDVKTGFSYNGEIEIIEGLTGNELIVDKGSRIVKHDQKVNIVE